MSGQAFGEKPAGKGKLAALVEFGEAAEIDAVTLGGEAVVELHPGADAARPDLLDAGVLEVQDPKVCLQSDAGVGKFDLQFVAVAHARRETGCIFAFQIPDALGSGGEGRGAFGLYLDCFVEPEAMDAGAIAEFDPMEGLGFLGLEEHRQAKQGEDKPVHGRDFLEPSMKGNG